MALKHTPAHTTSHPDHFEDEETGWGYSVLRDTDAEDPRTWPDNQHAIVYIYRGPAYEVRGHAEAVPRTIAALAFNSYCWDHDADRALELTRRYLAEFHPEEKISVAVQTVREHNSGDWIGVFAAVAEDHGTPEGHLEQFRMWASGDVWTVIPDGKPGLSGIYADDAQAALDYYRKNYEDDMPTTAETTGALDAHEPRGPYLVTWQIDSNEEVSPAQAALDAWQQNFRRGVHRPAHDDACVFTVLDRSTGRNVEIDLSAPEYAHLFTSEEN